MSIDPHELIRHLYAAGAEVSLTGANTVRVTGQSVPKGLIRQLQEHKQEIIRILQAQGVGSNDDEFDSPLPRRYVVPPACLATKACARLKPCPQSLMRHGCVRVAEPPSGGAPSSIPATATERPDTSTGDQRAKELQHVGS